MIGALPRTTAAIVEGIEGGLHPGAQVYVSLDGKAVGDGALGEARAGQPITTDHMIIWFSMTKAVVAVAVAQLWDRGRIGLDDPVARHVPEFAAAGKERVTIRHCLTHTGGFRGGDGVHSDSSDPGQWWAEVMAGICAVAPEPGWEPGRKAGYHLLAGVMVLAEVVNRVDGRFFSRYVREEIFGPLGMDDCWVGMPEERIAGYEGRLGTMHHTGSGMPLPLERLDSPGWLTYCVPGANGRGPMNQLGRLYEALLGGGQRLGARILSAQAAEAVTARHRSGMVDETFGVVCDWALGFSVDGATMGRHCSRRAFGHGGALSALAFADPDHGLVVAVQTNGMAAPDDHHRRFAAISDAVYEDLGLADPADPGRDKAFARDEGAAALLR